MTIISTGGRTSGIIDSNVIARRVADENFDKLVEKLKGYSKQERINAAKGAFNVIVGDMRYIWDDAPDQWIQPFMKFISIGYMIGCAGLETVPKDKVSETADYFEIVGIKQFFLENGNLFDHHMLNDELYCAVVNDFLHYKMEPLMTASAEVVVGYFTYMLLVACAGTVNKNGIKTIKKLRREYYDYAPGAKTYYLQTNRMKQFTATFDKSIFMSPEELKAAEEERARKAKEEAEKKKRARQEAEVKRKAEKEKKQKAYEAAMEKYNVDHAKWETERDSVTSERKKEIESLLDAEKKKIESAAKEKHDEAVKQNKDLISELTIKKGEAELKLSSLGIFKFGEKKAQKAIIEEAERKIAEAKAAIDSAEAEYRSEVESFDEKYSAAEKKIRAKVEKKYPLSKEPVKPKL